MKTAQGLAGGPPRIPRGAAGRHLRARYGPGRAAEGGAFSPGAPRRVRDFSCQDRQTGPARPTRQTLFIEVKFASRKLNRVRANRSVTFSPRTCPCGSAPQDTACQQNQTAGGPGGSAPFSGVTPGVARVGAPPRRENASCGPSRRENVRLASRRPGGVARWTLGTWVTRAPWTLPYETTRRHQVPLGPPGPPR